MRQSIEFAERKAGPKSDENALDFRSSDAQGEDEETLKGFLGREFTKLSWLASFSQKSNRRIAWLLQYHTLRKENSEDLFLSNFKYIIFYIFKLKLSRIRILKNQRRPDKGNWYWTVLNTVIA